MSYYLAGSMFVFPQKLNEKERSNLKEHFKKVKDFLCDPNTLNYLAQDDADENFKSTTAKMTELCPSMLNELEEQGFYGAENYQEIKPVLERGIDAIEKIDIILKQEYLFSDGEQNLSDVFWRTFKMLGRQYVCFFAGDSCSGDRPEGPGYRILRELGIVDFDTALEKECFPNNNAEHFITEII